MSDEEKDDLFVHIIRRRTFFDEALAYLPLDTLQDEEDKYTILLNGCHRVAKESTVKPGSKKFKRVLKSTLRTLAQQLSYDENLAEAANDLTAEGGFIDEAFAVAKAELSDALGRSLLKRYLNELLVVTPLTKLLSECRIDNELPANFPEVLETLQQRVRQLEGIESKEVKTFGEEWEDHEARLKHYRGRKMVGLTTGMAELDRRTLGLRGLFILGAKPGAGKSTYAAGEVAIGVCRNHSDNDCVVVVICLDMDRFDLYRRIHCNLGDIEWVPLMFGSPEEEREPGSMFSEPDQERLKLAKKRLKGWQVGKRLLIPDRTVLGEEITVHRLSAIIQEHKAKVGAQRALIVIDYLQLIPVPEEVIARGDLAADKYRVRLIQQVIERSRTTADPLGDTALVISEARKPPTAKEKDHWGDSMAELMGSARLGYAGDAVLLYREMNNKEMGTYYGVLEKDAIEKRRQALREQGIAPVMLILEKGRDGMMRGAWGAEFFFRKSQFRELLPNQHLIGSLPPPPDEEDEDSDDTDQGVAGSSKSHIPLPPPSNGFAGKAKKKGKSNKAASKTKAAKKPSKKHPK